MEISIVILAAGAGTRMKSSRPKVLQLLAGRPLLQHVIAYSRHVGTSDICVVYGHGGDEVRAVMAAESLRWALEVYRCAIKTLVPVDTCEIAEAAKKSGAAGGLPPGTIPEFICPVAGSVHFTNDWGNPRSGGRTHKGTDMFAARGVPVVAVTDGTLRFSSDGLGGIGGELERGADLAEAALQIAFLFELPRLGQVSLDLSP